MVDVSIIRTKPFRTAKYVTRFTTHAAADARPLIVYHTAPVDVLDLAYHVVDADTMRSADPTWLARHRAALIHSVSTLMYA